MWRTEPLFSLQMGKNHITLLVIKTSLILEDIFKYNYHTLQQITADHIKRWNTLYLNFTDQYNLVRSFLLLWVFFMFRQFP